MIILHLEAFLESLIVQIFTWLSLSCLSTCIDHSNDAHILVPVIIYKYIQHIVCLYACAYTDKCIHLYTHMYIYIHICTGALSNFQFCHFKNFHFCPVGRRIKRKRETKTNFLLRSIGIRQKKKKRKTWHVFVSFSDSFPCKVSKRYY